MTFEDILNQAAKMLQRRGRVSLRAFKRQFELDEEYLEDVIFELVEVQKIATEENGILIWRVEEASKEFNTDKDRSSDNYQKELRRDIAERRQLTVMFIDLVGSTQLSQALDPEDFRDVIYRYQELCDKSIYEHKGVVMQHLGDGIVAYFGYPIAHENDPRRAILAGISILKTLSEYNKSFVRDKNISLQVRIGIHTGIVVVGATGGKAYSEMTAIGEVPNLTARIQGIAEPDSIMISEATMKLVQDHIEISAAGSYKLKGFSEPVNLYLVLGEKQRALFDLAFQDSVFTLVGRERERQKINEKWKIASNSQGQVVLVSGEAGIGKSFLARALVRELAQKGVELFTFRCSPFNQNTAFQPIIESLHHIVLGQEIAPETRVTKLRSFLSENGFNDHKDFTVCASLLSIPTPKDMVEPKVSAERLKIYTYDWVTRWVIGTKKPSLVFIEDIHWADPSTIELLGHLIKAITHVPLMLIATFRPEFKNVWKNGANISHLILKNLNKSEAKVMISRVAPNLPQVVIEDLVDRTDGNPLFIEEVTKFIMESGAIKEDGGKYRLKGSIGNLTIPNTLQDSLMARLDQVGQAKEIAQIGATIGREFSKSLVKAISNYDEELLDDYLGKLVLAQLLLVNPELPNFMYAFKHALIQEAAYSSLLKKRRQEFHTKIVTISEQMSPELVMSNPELLAHHCTKAGMIEKAIPYWRKAGELAISRSAHEEAISHLNNGLVLLESLPDSTQRVSDEILFQIALGVPLTALRGYGSIEVEKAYARARELCQKAGETWQLIPALYGLWRYYLLRAQYHEARELSDQILQLSVHSDDPTHAVIGNRASGSTSFYLGNLETARKNFDFIFDSHTTPEGRANTLLYDVVDAWVTAKSYASLTYWLLGYPDEALKHSNDAINMAKRLDHPFSKALSLSFAAWYHQFRGDVQKTFECAHEGLNIARENGFAFWVGWGEILEGWAKEENGSEAQLELIKGGLKTWYDTGSKLGSSYFLFLLSESLMINGNYKEAGETITKAKHFISKTGERWWESEVYRLEGILLESQKEPDLEGARKCFHKALEIAGAQKSKSLELRAATDLTRIVTTKKERDESKILLEDLINWFNEKDDTEDVVKAKTQLARLS